MCVNALRVLLHGQYFFTWYALWVLHRLRCSCSNVLLLWCASALIGCANSYDVLMHNAPALACFCSSELLLCCAPALVCSRKGYNWSRSDFFLNRMWTCFGALLFYTCPCRGCTAPALLWCSPAIMCFWIRCSSPDLWCPCSVVLLQRK